MHLPSLPTPTGTATHTTSQSSGPSNTASSTMYTTTSSTSVNDSHSSDVSKTGVVSGVAAGMGVLVLVSTLIFCSLRRRHRKKLAAGSKLQSFPMTNEGFHELPDTQSMLDKPPGPVEMPSPLPSPSPSYMPKYSGAVEIDNSHRAHVTDRWGQPVFEVLAQPYRVC